jgi:hypothetical protein
MFLSYFWILSCWADVENDIQASAMPTKNVSHNSFSPVDQLKELYITSLDGKGVFLVTEHILETEFCGVLKAVKKKITKRPCLLKTYQVYYNGQIISVKNKLKDGSIVDETRQNISLKDLMNFNPKILFFREFDPNHTKYSNFEINNFIVNFLEAYPKHQPSGERFALKFADYFFEVGRMKNKRWRDKAGIIAAYSGFLSIYSFLVASTL